LCVVHSEFLSAQGGQQEPHQEDDRRSEDDRQIGMQRAVEPVEGRTLVDQRREAHPGDRQQAQDHRHDGMGAFDRAADHTQQKETQHTAAEDRGQFPPGIQHAVDAHHQKAHDDAQRPDDERRHVQHPHTALFGELPLREAPGEVRQYDRGRGVDARRHGGHPGREERRDDQARQSRGESVDDEPREDLIGGGPGRQEFGLRRVVGEERRADVDEDERHGDVEQPAEEGRLHRLGRRFGRHVALHVVLVDAVVLHVDEESVDEHHPEGRLREACPEAPEAELAVCRGDLEELARAFGHREGQEQGAGHGPDDEDDTLNGIGPDHGGNTAQQRIDQRGDARADDNRRHVPAEHRMQRKGQQQQDRTDARQLRQQVADRRIAPRPVAEAEFQVVVRRDAVDVAVEGDEDLGCEPRGDGDREAEDEGVPVSLVGIAGQPQEADAADERGEDRHPHDPRRERPFGRREGRGTLAAAEVERAAEKGDTADKKEEDDIIEDGYIHGCSG